MNNILIIFLILLLFGLIGGIVYYMIYYKQSDKSNTNDLSKINECKNKGNKYSFINKDQSC